MLATHGRPDSCKGPPISQAGVEQRLSLIANEYGPNGGLLPHDWIWTEDEIAFRYYQSSNLKGATRIAGRLAEATNVPLEVSNKALCLLGMCYLQQQCSNEAATIVFRVVNICEKHHDRQDMRLCLFSTLFDLGVLFRPLVTMWRAWITIAGLCTRSKLSGHRATLRSSTAVQISATAMHTARLARSAEPTGTGIRQFGMQLAPESRTLGHGQPC